MYFSICSPNTSLSSFTVFFSSSVNRSTLITKIKACGPGEANVMHLTIYFITSSLLSSVSLSPGVSMTEISLLFLTVVSD